MVETRPSPAIEVTFWSSDDRYGVNIHDDGRVGYAYFADADGICGDVWLYNRGPAPKEPEWTDPEKAPFANPEAFVVPLAALPLPTSADDFYVEWRMAEDAVEAWIFVHGRPLAKLMAGAKPGWSVLVSRDGPLAKVLKL
jgi:hypothetical protein